MATALFACKKSTHIDVKGDPEVKFFTLIESPANTPANSFSYTALNIPNTGGSGWINSTNSFPSSIKFPVRASKAVGEDVTITAEIDNSLVAAYNEANDTEYQTFPADVFNLEKASATILAGEARSMDSIVIVPDGSKLGPLVAGNYMAAIRLKTVSKPTVGSVTSNEKINTVYIVSSVEQRQIWYNAGTANITGTLVSPRTSWTASYDPTPVATSGGSIFDGSTGSYQRWPNGTTSGLLTVDMQSARNVSAIRLYTSNNTTYTPTRIDVYLSTDGVNYELMGSPLKANLAYTSSYNYIVFYKPTSARYIRLRLYYSTSTNTQNFRVTEFDVYATN